MALIGRLLLIPKLSRSPLHAFFLDDLYWRIFEKVLRPDVESFIKVELGRHLVIFKVICLEIGDSLGEVLNVLSVSLFGSLVHNL